MRLIASDIQTSDVSGTVYRYMFQESLKMLSSTRSSTLAMAQPLSQRQLDFAYAPGKWSAGEVLDHLLLAEKLNRDQISELIELKKGGRKAFVRRSFADVNVSIAHIPKPVLPFLEIPFTLLNMCVPDGVREYMARNRVIPAQNPDSATPRRGRAAAQLGAELAASLKQTEDLLRANPDLNYDEMFVQHPLMGTNDVPGLLRFMALHEQRHQSQIGDILAHPRFPRAAATT